MAVWLYAQFREVVTLHCCKCLTTSNLFVFVTLREHGFFVYGGSANQTMLQYCIVTCLDGLAKLVLSLAGLTTLVRLSPIGSDRLRR